MTIGKSITEDAADFVFDLFKNKLQSIYVYHNLDHTEEVVEAIKKIGIKTGLNEEDLEIVTLAGWFHDTGFIERSENHEDISIEIARKFLTERNYNPDNISLIIGCINATRFPQAPTNILEEIICDADLFHIGSKNYFSKSDLLRLEWEKSSGKFYNEIEWLKINIDFLTAHKFFTKYAKKSCGDNKSELIVKLQKKYRDKIEEEEKKKIKEIKLDIQKQKLDSKTDPENNFENSIEDILRDVIRNHAGFSTAADSNANVMISINSLISVGLIIVLLLKLDSSPQLLIPVFLLLTVCLVCIVLGVLVTKPVITSGVFTKDELKNKKVNLLFWGNFFKMELKDLQSGIDEMKNDRDFLYKNMVKDFYFLGQVLSVKYRFLRICYSVFTFGLIISLIAFTLAYLTLPDGLINFFQ
ncbi:MAG: HD domain-containing protein [Bacteroidetes bacterium]|nr:HD domain-containing protein [Bacteroidota bacterium]